MQYCFGCDTAGLNPTLGSVLLADEMHCSMSSNIVFSSAEARVGCSKLALILGKNLTLCFSLCISARPFISKLQKSKLLLIRTRFLKKYFQVYKQAVRKYTFNFKLTYRVKQTGF